MIDHNSDLGPCRDLPEELIDALLCGLVVVGRQHQRVFRPALRGIVGQFYGGLCRVHAGARHHMDPAAHDLTALLDELLALLYAHHVVLAGGAAHQHAVHAALNYIVDDSLVALIVDALVRVERSDQRHEQTLRRFAAHFLFLHL